ncbi:MAG: hypothetical protein HY446_00500 [Candidatus Niyogibacteria bacterium]|nr:hypothetical protein [Candidatus Niyogibacteria bacterium]
MEYSWQNIVEGWIVLLGLPVILAVIAWTLVWKGMALWKAARAGDKRWFIALLVINTAGILEILYLYVFSRKGESAEQV